MKHLKKHPKQQRMEDMTFPLLKVDPNPKSLGFAVAIKKSLDEGTMPANKPIKKYKAGTEFVVAKKWMNSSDKPKDKVIWEGREWLRYINDDMGFKLMTRLEWRMVAVSILAGAIAYALLGLIQ